MQEGDGEEDGPGHERGDGDGDPDLLGAALDLLDELALHLSADRPGLRR